MSRFYVGQRVRIVGRSASGLTGREATVIGHTHNSMHAEYGLGDWILVDADGFGRVSKSGLRLSFPASSLAPIQPEGAAPSEFKTLQDLLSSLEGVAA